MRVLEYGLTLLQDTIFIVETIFGGPSEAVGILPGDKIIRVDGDTIAGIGINNRGVIDLLRGPKGTKVVVDIKRGKMKPCCLLL